MQHQGLDVIRLLSPIVRGLADFKPGDQSRKASGGVESSNRTYPQQGSPGGVPGAIRCKAEQYGIDINTKAEEVGCNRVARH